MGKRRRGKVAWRAVAWVAVSIVLYSVAGMATDLPGWLRVVAGLLGAFATSSYAVEVNKPQRSTGPSREPLHPSR